MSAHPWKMVQSTEPPRIYFSGHVTSKRPSGERATEIDLCKRIGWRYRCYSYDALRRSRMIQEEMATFLSHPDSRLLLDSGAFTFRKVGAIPTEREIDVWIEEYASFYHGIVSRHPGQVDIVVTFDFVAHSPTILEMTKRLMKLGVPAMPVYHADYPVSWLTNYLDLGIDYIGIGKPYFPAGPAVMRPIYESAFNFAAKHGVRLHGFGETGSSSLLYPWFSVDSSRWLISAYLGRVFLRTPWRTALSQIAVTKRSLTKMDGSVHMDSLDPVTRKVLLEEISSLGYDPERIRIDKFERLCHNASWMITHSQEIIGGAVAGKCCTRTQWRPVI